jgi:drug/metabolite transporter (DMT)-like permease
LKTKDWFIFFLLGAIWSSSFLWIKIALQEVGPLTLVAFRVSFGLLFGIVAVIVSRARAPRHFREWLPLLVLGISNVAIPFLLISWGEQSIDSAVAAVLDATVPLFAIVISHFALGDDKITLPKALGLLLGFGGVLILLSRDFGPSPGSLIGQAAVVLASIFYAGSSVYARKFTENIPGLFRSVGPLVSSTAVMWLAAMSVDRHVVLPARPATWFALLWLGILGSGLAFILLYYLIHAIGPTRTTMVTFLFPLGGVILGVSFLGEPLTWQLVLGGLLIVGSLAVANRGPTPDSTDSPGNAAPSLDG